MATVLSNLKIPVHLMDARSFEDGYAVMNVVMDLNGVDQLEYVVGKLRGIQGVIDIKRTLS